VNKKSRHYAAISAQYRKSKTKLSYLPENRLNVGLEAALAAIIRNKQPLWGATYPHDALGCVKLFKTESSMKLIKALGTALIAVSLSAPALAQQANAQPDRIDQLAQMVGLNDEQQEQIRGVFDELQGQIVDLRQQAQTLQQQLQAEVKADFSEDAIREHAEELGDVTGEMAALSALMQAKVESIFTDEQRNELKMQMQKMQQMQQQRQQGGQ
jgi:protein CpxP